MLAQAVASSLPCSSNRVAWPLAPISRKPAEQQEQLVFARRCVVVSLLSWVDASASPSLYVLAFFRTCFVHSTRAAVGMVSRSADTAAVKKTEQ